MKNYYKDYYQEEIALLALHLSGEYYKVKNRDYFWQGELSGFELLYKFYSPSKAKEIFTNAQREIEKCAAKNIFVITALDSRYPKLLKEIKDPPLAFFAAGNIGLLAQEKISMVGTRNPSPGGRFLTSVIANHFSKERVVVSGMAMGIDAVSHWNALKHKGTIGVVAQGFAHWYPAENYDLYRLVFEEHSPSMLLISEYSLQTPAYRFHFPRRNRIIAGLSPTTLFLEGGIKSGANITAQYALDQGRDVMVLDHPYMPENEGAKKWLDDGAINLSDVMNIESGRQEHINLIQKLQDPSFAYLGNGRWLRAEFANAFLSA